MDTPLRLRWAGVLLDASHYPHMLFCNSFGRPPRGPPKRVAEQHVWVVGSVKQYTGPTQSERSIHTATVLDVDLSATAEQKALYESELRAWRSEVAAKAGMEQTLFA